MQSSDIRQSLKTNKTDGFHEPCKVAQQIAKEVERQQGAIVADRGAKKTMATPSKDNAKATYPTVYC